MEREGFVRRRDFLARAVAAGAVSFASLRSTPTLAQAASPRPLIAYLSISTLDARADRFVDAMSQLGWVLGQNYSLQFRATEGINERLPGLTQELLALKPDVFVAEGTRGAAAGAEATTTVPVIGLNMGEPAAIDPAGSNFARPKGNVTGLLFLAASNLAKVFELGAEIVPDAKRFAYLSDTFVVDDSTTAEAKKAAAVLGASLLWVNATTPADVAGASRRIGDGAVVAHAASVRNSRRCSRSIVHPIG